MSRMRSLCSQIPSTVGVKLHRSLLIPQGWLGAPHRGAATGSCPASGAGFSHIQSRTFLRFPLDLGMSED
jgi:hypothetical protein